MNPRSVAARCSRGPKWLCRPLIIFDESGGNHWFGSSSGIIHFGTAITRTTRSASADRAARDAAGARRTLLAEGLPQRCSPRARCRSTCSSGKSIPTFRAPRAADESHTRAVYSETTAILGRSYASDVGNPARDARRDPADRAGGAAADDECEEVGTTKATKFTKPKS